MRPASSGPCGPAGGDNLKSVAAILDWPPLRAPLRDFIDWVGALDARRRAAWCCAWRSARGEVAAPPAPKFGLVATGKAPARMTDARARVLAALADRGAPTPKAALAALAGCSPGVIDGLVADGALVRVALAAGSGRGGARPGFLPRRASTPISAPRPTISLARVADRAFSATLLEGVTGSGKTEVYFEAVAEGAAAGAPGAGAAAGNRADRAIPRPVRGALRRPAGRMAFGADRAPARARLGGGGERRGARRRRRALGAVPAVRRPRPHRRRRGARGRLQAGGRRHLQRARHGGRARTARSRRRSCSPPPRPRSRPGSMPRRAAIAG